MTYDGGTTWIPLAEVHGNATPATTLGSVSCYGVNGHLLCGGSAHARPMNYTGHANPVAGIVKGHAVTHDHLTGIRGAMVIRSLKRISNTIYTWWIDTVWTNELGNFVFAAINDTVHYDYTLSGTDSGNAKTYTWQGVSAKAGEIITLGFADSAFPPPPPDTQHASVAESSRPAIALSIERAETGALCAVMTLPAGGTRRRSGRTVNF